MTYIFIGIAVFILLFIIGLPIFLLIWAMKRKQKVGKFPWAPFLVVFIIYVLGLTGFRQVALSIMGVTGNNYGIQSLGGDINNPVTNNSVKNQNITTTGTLLFTDDKKIFSFEYPSGYSAIKSVDPTPIGGTSFQANYTYSNSDGNWYIQVVTSPFETNEDPVAYLAKQKENYDRNYKNVSNRYVAGEMAVMFDNVGGTTSRNIDFIHRGLSYSVSFSGYGKNPQDDMNIDKAFGLVLSSLTFLQ